METDEKIRIGYQTSIQLITYQGQIIWRAFSALVSVNTGLTAIVGVALAWFPNILIGIGAMILACLGFLICYAWYRIIIREFHYYSFWYAWARHYERSLSPEVRIATIGRTYGEGGTIPADKNIPADIERFSPAARRYSVHKLMKFVVIVYVIIYLLLFIAGLMTILGIAPLSYPLKTTK